MVTRPSKLNDDLIANLSKEIEDGMPFNYACDLCEVRKTNFDDWMKQGLSDVENEIQSVHAKFYVSIKKSYAKFIKSCKKKIRDGEVGWQGTAWWLERTNRDFQINTENQQIAENIIINTKMKTRKVN